MQLSVVGSGSPLCLHGGARKSRCVSKCVREAKMPRLKAILGFDAMVSKLKKSRTRVIERVSGEKVPVSTG